MIRVKANSLLTKSIKSSKEIEVFNHYVFDQSWALREAINSKTLHVKAVLDTLRKANKFKDWLSDLDSDSNLLREYVSKIQEKSPLERLPAKSIRFYLCVGLGVILGAVDPQIGIPVGMGITAFDSFLLENLAKKWRPNQFIENDFRKLVINK